MRVFNEGIFGIENGALMGENMHFLKVNLKKNKRLRRSDPTIRNPERLGSAGLAHIKTMMRIK